MNPPSLLPERGTLDVYVRLGHPNSRCRAEVLQPREVEATITLPPAVEDGTQHLYIVTLRESNSCGTGDAVRTPAGPTTFLVKDEEGLRTVRQTINSYFARYTAA